MGNDRALGMIGLAKKAGKVISGESMCDKAIKSGTAHLVIIAGDASDLTKKSVKDSCVFYKTQFVEYADKESLGRFCGGGIRAVVCVNDKNFASAILDKMKD